MSKQHAKHEYGFFAEVAPSYRKKLGSQKSQITAQESSISNALGEIEAAETNVENHAQKCQEDVESTFEEMISVLQTCKQAMKDEVTAYYGSLTGVFDEQKEKLKAIQSKMKSVVASIDTTVLDDDQSFLARMDSTFERISNLQKKFQAASLTVAKPQLLAMRAVEVDSITQYMKTKCSLFKLADANMCSVDSLPFRDAKVYVGQQMAFTLTLRDLSGNISIGENYINICLLSPPQSILIKGKLESLSEGQVKAILMLDRRGQHQLNVKVNGAHIKDSPFTVIVHMPPNLLSRPVAIISELDRPASLVYSQAEDIVFATIMGEHRIINVKVDSQFCITQQDFIKVDIVNEITHDAVLNIFFVTTQEYQLHKFSSDGRIIKTIGQMGKRNAEFKYPNGLRVSKNNELYVCDSYNHRVQVFDLDLYYKRSFGKKGTGRGQFNFPADVDFDSCGNIYITDMENHRIQVFTCTECHIRNIIINSQLGSVGAFRPVSLLVHDEKLYVTDAGNHSVWVMSATGETIATFGGGILRSPEGITMDREGFVYVTSHRSKIFVF